MKKISLFVLIIFAAALTISAGFLLPSQISVSAETADTRAENTTPLMTTSPFPFTWPIADAQNRITKKPFGLKIEPGHSPVINDRFTGYHVGVDFETFETEQDVDIPIYAICDGRLLFKKFAHGYGGIAVQECRLNEQDISVVYGHLNLSRIEAVTGDSFIQGQRIGILGKGYSDETDGVRKHLHLGIYAGSRIDIRGYVQDQSEITQWLDALEYMPH